ncbi:MAG TPA: hypothetical protein VK638_43410 [Edaphobacter sp.]|nr:hypothetical protein [Edaphobacter sp.]
MICKFEAILLPVVLSGRFRLVFPRALFPLVTLLLEGAEFGGGFVRAAGKACFLELEASDLLFVGEEGVDVYER